jgi:hypothetical protein
MLIPREQTSWIAGVYSLPEVFFQTAADGAWNGVPPAVFAEYLSGKSGMFQRFPTW